MNSCGRCNSRALIDRRLIAPVPGIADADIARPGKQMSVARVRGVCTPQAPDPWSAQERSRSGAAR